MDSGNILDICEVFPPSLLLPTSSPHICQFFSPVSAGYSQPLSSPSDSTHSGALSHLGLPVSSSASGLRVQDSTSSTSPIGFHLALLSPPWPIISLALPGFLIPPTQPWSVVDPPSLWDSTPLAPPHPCIHLAPPSDQTSDSQVETRWGVKRKLTGQKVENKKGGEHTTTLIETEAVFIFCSILYASLKSCKGHDMLT